MATSSIDGSVKIWDLNNTTALTPTCVMEKAMNAGDIYACKFF